MLFCSRFQESSERPSPQDDVVADLPCSPAVNRKSKFPYNPLRGARHSFSIDYGDVLPVPRGNRYVRTLLHSLHFSTVNMSFDRRPFRPVSVSLVPLCEL